MLCHQTLDTKEEKSERVNINLKNEGPPLQNPTFSSTINESCNCVRVANTNGIRMFDDSFLYTG